LILKSATHRVSAAAPTAHARWWSNQFDWFDIDDDASRFFVGKYDQGYDPGADRHIRGLYWSDYGSTRQQYADIYDDLPCNGSCNNLNMAHQLRTLSKKRLTGCAGRLDDQTIRNDVRTAIRTQVDLD